MNILKSLSASERELNKFRKVVEQINALEPEMQSLSDEQLRAKTDELKARLRTPEELPEGDQNEWLREKLGDLLVEAFAVVREARVRLTVSPAPDPIRTASVRQLPRRPHPLCDLLLESVELFFVEHGPHTPLPVEVEIR